MSTRYVTECDLCHKEIEHLRRYRGTKGPHDNNLEISEYPTRIRISVMTMRENYGNAFETEHGYDLCDDCFKKLSAIIDPDNSILEWNFSFKPLNNDKKEN